MAALAEWKKQDSLTRKHYEDGLEATGMGDIAGRGSSVPMRAYSLQHVIPHGEKNNRPIGCIASGCRDRLGEFRCVVGLFVGCRERDIRPERTGIGEGCRAGGHAGSVGSHHDKSQEVLALPKA